MASYHHRQREYQSLEHLMDYNNLSFESAKTRVKKVGPERYFVLCGSEHNPHVQLRKYDYARTPFSEYGKQRRSRYYDDINMFESIDALEYREMLALYTPDNASFFIENNNHAYYDNEILSKLMPYYHSLFRGFVRIPSSSHAFTSYNSAFTISRTRFDPDLLLPRQAYLQRYTLMSPFKFEPEPLHFPWSLLPEEAWEHALGYRGKVITKEILEHEQDAALRAKRKVDEYLDWWEYMYRHGASIYDEWHEDNINVPLNYSLHNDIREGIPVDLIRYRNSIIINRCVDKLYYNKTLLPEIEPVWHVGSRYPMRRAHTYHDFIYSTKSFSDTGHYRGNYQYSDVSELNYTRRILRNLLTPLVAQTYVLLESGWKPLV